jgi:DNA polymerase-3 subunit gamma/tau
MNAQQANLNLARKWRPQSFEHVIGQDTSVRMLKNSLYLKKFFPVYLFAGQRGCGKTSTARVFAAAVNCASLGIFQANPAAQVPCLTCASCLAMANGNHADFIEIDAASHTGVDNVRQIIESSSYMPLSGQKKIYLIDEAHMLSKAAFNAFLKILEEPPTSVMFILATTEIPKLPATVLSRCFQVMFNPLPSEALKEHLVNICAQESVVADPEALELIIAETEGSARDAINLLERVRFSGDHITEQTVLAVLGKISTTELIQLFQLLIAQKPAEMLTQLATIGFEQRSAQLLWDMIVHLCRHIVWLKYGVATAQGAFTAHNPELEQLAKNCSINRLTAILNLLWHQEELFQRTSKKHIFLEMVLLQICQQVNAADLDTLITAYRQTTQPARSYPQQAQSSYPQVAAEGRQPVAAAQFQPAPPPQITQPVAQPLPQQMQPPATQQAPSPASSPAADSPLAAAWQQFVAAVAEQNDVLLTTIFRQSTFIKAEADSNKVVIQLSADSAFFKNKIDETAALWQPLLAKAFEAATGFSYIAAPANAAPPPRQRPIAAPLNTPSAFAQVATEHRPPPRPAQHNQQQSYQQKAPERKEYAFITIKNPSQWPNASLLLKHFPGKIKKIKQLGPVNAQNQN